MTTFISNAPVDMIVLEEIALLTGNDTEFDFAGPDLMLSHIGNVSFLFTGDPDTETVNGLAVITGGTIKYQFLGFHVAGDPNVHSVLDVLNLTLSGDDDVIGSNGADNLVALRGSDRIDGRNGDDVINGGRGLDRLSGGAGRDTFVFDYLPSSGRNADIIRDMHPHADQIALDSGAFAGLGKLGELDGDRFHVGRKAADHHDRILYDDRTGALFYDSDGVGKAHAVKFAIVSPGLHLTHHDFDVV